MEFDHILPYLVSAYRRGTLVIVQGPTRVGDIKQLCALKSELWGAEIFPRPNKVPLASSQEEADLIVGPTSTVVFSPRP